MDQQLLEIFLTILMIGAPWALAFSLFMIPNVRTRFFGHPRQRAKPWGGFEVLAIFLLTQIVWTLLVSQILAESNLLDHFYGAGFSEAHRQSGHGENAGLPSFRFSLWATILAFPLNIATVLGIPTLARNARPYQLGLTSHGWSRNLAGGVLFFVAITPMVYAVNIAAEKMVEQVSQDGPGRHPFDEITKQADSKVDWVLVGFAVLIVAPIYEELFFRGLLQGWLSKRSWGGLGAFLLALVLSILFRESKLRAALMAREWQDLALQLCPMGFVLATGPTLLLIRKLKKPEAAGAIYGSGLLFAIAHTSVWPSPIPLLLLGLGLGWLAHRSQSLVSSIVVHSLFNGIGFLGMILRQTS